MKVALICNTEALAMPSIHYLAAQNLLTNIFILEKNAAILQNQIIAAGVTKEQICLVRKDNFESLFNLHIQQSQPDVLLVFGFPWHIPNSVLNSLPKGAFNFHFGLLPKYKGADPIFWQIKNGEQKAGLVVHRITPQIDEGPIIINHEVSLHKGETYGMHCSRMGFEAIACLQYLLDNKEVLTEKKQEITNDTSFWKKPNTDDLEVNWEKQTAEEIMHLVNASNPKYGGISAYLGNNECRFLEVDPIDMNINEKVDAGTIVHADAVYGLIVACINNSFLRIQIVHNQDGYLSGVKLFTLGVSLGQKFIQKEKTKHVLVS
ncbi:MAG: formyltransferase family protein [Bacteroidota bacterium]